MASNNQRESLPPLSGNGVPWELRLLHDAAEATAANSVESALEGSNAEKNTPFPSINGYEILCELSSGGMGVIYKALRISESKQVALKVIKTGILATPDEKERFKREGEMLAWLSCDKDDDDNSNNIVKIYDRAEQNGQHYICMELMEGGSFADRLKNGYLAFNDAAKLIATLARAVHYVHQHGIFHRDLKPGNVLFTGDEVPKITDFGLAKQLDEGVGLTKSGTAVGTPEYMAPEQAEGSKNLTTAVDVYSLGAILYEALTACPPFSGKSDAEVRHRVCFEDPIQPSKLRGEKIPRDLENICLKCLEKNPSRRYGSAEALAEDLERWIHGEPIEARPNPAWEKAVKWVNRHPTISSIAAVIALTLTAWGIYGKVKNDELEVALKQSDENLRQAVRIAISQGRELCQRGQVDHGMLLFAFALTIVPKDDAALQQEIRQLLGSWYDNGPLYLQRPLQNLAEVNAAIFSRDGLRIVVGCADGSVRLLDRSSFRELGVLKHQGSVQSVALALDGRRILTGGQAGAGGKGAAWLWDANNSNQPIQCLDHPGEVHAVVLSPNARFAVSGCEDGKARLWDLTDPTHPSCRILPAPRESPRRSVGGASLALGVSLKCPLCALPILFQQSKKSAILSLALSPDGRTVLAGDKDGFVCRWDVSCEPIVSHPLQWSGGTVRTLAYSPNGKWFAAGGDGASGGGETRLWDAATGAALGRAMHYSDSVRTIHFSPDSHYFLAGTSGGEIQLQETPTGSQVGAPFRLPMLASALTASFSPSGHEICVGGGFQNSMPLMELLKVLNQTVFQPSTTAKPGTTEKPTEEPTEKPGFLTEIDSRPLRRTWVELQVKTDVSALAWTPDGKAILTASEVAGGESEIQLWNAATGNPLRPSLHYPGTVRALAVSPDGESAIIGGELSSGRGEARLWTFADGSLSDSLPHPQAVLALCIGPDGWLLTGCEDRFARLWDMRTGREIYKLQHRFAVKHVALSPDGKFILTGSSSDKGDGKAVTFDGEAQLWDAMTGEPRGEPFEHGSIDVAVFCPNSKQAWVESCQGSNTIAGWWDVTGIKPKVIKRAEHQPDRALTVAFSSDGQTFMTTFRAGFSVFCKNNKDWEPDMLPMCSSPLIHGHTISVAAFSPDSKALATNALNGTVRVWRLPAQVEGSPECIALWVQLWSTYELGQDGNFRSLNGPALRERRQRLDELGGPPVP